MTTEAKFTAKLEAHLARRAAEKGPASMEASLLARMQKTAARKIADAMFSPAEREALDNIDPDCL